MANKTNNTRLIGVSTILTALFATSKVFQVGICATWSWWWIFSPIWIPICALLIIAAFAGLLYLVVKSLK